MESPNFDSLIDYMEYYGIQFADESDYEIITESIKDKIDNARFKLDRISKKKAENNEKKKEWNASAKKVERNEKSVYNIDNKTFNKMREVFDTMKKSNIFIVYKAAFKQMCNFLRIDGESTFNGIYFKAGKQDNDNSIHFNASGKARKIIIPNGSLLIHTTKVKGLNSLKPSWKSRTEGRFLYPEQRVYFSIGKPIDPKKAGLEKSETVRYTPRETFSVAWIDPEASNYKDGAIFIKTSVPIPVVPLIEKSKKFFGFEYDKKLVVDKK